MDSKSYFEFNDELENISVVLKNWQDTWENNRVSFDGLIDFKGRKKSIYSTFMNKKSGNVTKEGIETIRILVPSILLYPNDVVAYNAVMLKDGKWIYPDSLKYNNAFEWVLVKKDRYGNKLALKELGKGISKSVTIPKDYHKYELMLIYNKNNIVSSVSTQLNTRITNLSKDAFYKNTE
jgi:hypothetical protein